MQDIDEDEAREAVHEAFRLGINFFDTSPFYGNTKSETVLGKALVGLPRDQIVVATKVGRYGQETFDFSPETVKARFQESLQRLQLEYVDILQCHDIEFGDLAKVRSRQLRAARCECTCAMHTATRFAAALHTACRQPSCSRSSYPSTLCML